MVTREYILDKLKNTMDCTYCEVEDISDGSAKFSVLIVSDVFIGKSLLQRHRLIYNIFTEEMNGPIHALSLKTYTTSEYTPA